MVDNLMVDAPIALQQLPFDSPLNVLSGHVSKPTIKIKHVAGILKYRDMTHRFTTSKPL